MIRPYLVYIEDTDSRTEAEQRIQVEIARHLAVIFGKQFKGVDIAGK